MANLDFAFEWESPGDAKGPELRATWARLQISVDSAVVTTLTDTANKALRTSVYLPLYPLAEWLVSNWWALVYEPYSTAAGDSDDTYTLRHSLRNAGDGFALPDLRIVPYGEFIELEWCGLDLPLYRLSFTTSGKASIRKSDLLHAMTSLVRAVVARLQESGIDSTLLQEDWAAIGQLDSEEREFCRLAGSLGLDPFAAGDEARSSIIDSSERLPDSVREDLFTATTIESLADDTDAVLAALTETRDNYADLPQLRQLRDIFGAVFPASERAWDQGRQTAMSLRRHLGLNGQPLRTLEELSGALRLSEGSLATAIVQSRSAAFDALVATNKRLSPAFAIPNRNLHSSRFGLCRALFEYLTDLKDDAVLVTSSRTEKQKRNRAFAAEFLAPASAIRSKLSGAIVTETEVEGIATHFNVSYFVARNQIQNNHLARILNTE